MYLCTKLINLQILLKQIAIITLRFLSCSFKGMQLQTIRLFCTNTKYYVGCNICDVFTKLIRTKCMKYSRKSTAIIPSSICSIGLQRQSSINTHESTLLNISVAATNFRSLRSAAFFYNVGRDTKQLCCSKYIQERRT
jgi:hypothetical protein